jgi:hypothetical protein
VPIAGVIGSARALSRSLPTLSHTFKYRDSCSARFALHAGLFQMRAHILLEPTKFTLAGSPRTGAFNTSGTFRTFGATGAVRSCHCYTPKHKNNVRSLQCSEQVNQFTSRHSRLRRMSVYKISRQFSSHLIGQIMKVCSSFNFFLTANRLQTPSFLISSNSCAIHQI